MRVLSPILLVCFSLLVLPIPAHSAAGDSFLYQCTKIIYHIAAPHFEPFQRMLHALKTADRSFEKTYVPLSALKLGHPLNYPIPERLEKEAKRVQNLRDRSADILSQNQVSISLQNELIPSKNPIRVFKMSNGDFVVLDGNGRLGSLQQAFQDSPNLQIEVEEIVIKNDYRRRNIERLLKRARAANNL